MSKGETYLDNQQQINFDDQIEELRSQRIDLEQHNRTGKSSDLVGNEDEICIEIAVSLKAAIRETGMSREQLVDAVNEYFHREEDSDGKKPLSIHMLNNYLSKPGEYPIPIYYLVAIIDLTGSLEPINSIAKIFGAQVISGQEIMHMALGKIEQNIAELQKMKRNLKLGRLS